MAQLWPPPAAKRNTEPSGEPVEADENSIKQDARASERAIDGFTRMPSWRANGCEAILPQTRRFAGNPVNR